MCIVFYTLSQPGYRLILASNRDEYLDRPATPAGWHDFGTTPSRGEEGDEAWVLSGRDTSSQAGGTWLGMTSDLRIGVMYEKLYSNTNIRYPQKSTKGDTPSRGKLLKDFLSPSPSSSERPKVEEYLRAHEENADQYEGFNLLLFDLKGDTQVGYLTNRPRATYTDLSPSEITAQDETGTYGLSNSPMNRPFEKVERGKGRMSEELNNWTTNKEDEEDLIERMMDLLSQSIPLTSLSDTTRSTLLKPLLVAPNPEIPIEEGQTGRWYGTRVSTVILVQEDGHVVFVESERALLVDGEVQLGSYRVFDFRA